MKKNSLFTSIMLILSVLTAQAHQIQVNVLNFSFSPKNFSANIGDTIHFVWAAGFHTTTSTSVPSGAATWDKPIDNTHLSFLYPVKVAGNYSYQCSFHFTMGMVGSFNVPFKAKIVATKTVSVNNCTNTNSIQYKCTLSKPPYSVQLFRYRQKFGSVRSVPDTLPFTFSSLPIGSYFATVKGHGGADTVFGKSSTSVLVPVPSGLSATHITSTKATLKWTPYSCVKFYTVNYRKKGVTTWTKINTIGNKDSINLTSLAANTKYQFRVAAADSAHKIIATGKFSATDSFITKAAAAITQSGTDLSNKGIFDQLEINNNEPIIVFPNPATSYFKIQTKNNGFVSALLRSIDGKIIWSESRGALLTKDKELNVDISHVAAGTYFLQLIDERNKSVVKKVVVIK